MSHIIIQAPNGLWCVWSTYVEEFIVHNATRDQIIEYELEQERDRLETMLDDIEEQGGRYYAPPQSYEELVERSDQTEKLRETLE